MIILLKLGVFSKGENVRKVFNSIIWVIAALVVFKSCQYSTAFLIGNDEQWESYVQIDKFRSLVYDRGGIYEDYEENKALYQSIGIKKEQVDLWYTNNSDPIYPSIEVRNSAMEIADESSKVSDYRDMLKISLLSRFFKIFPLKWLTIDVFFGVTVIILVFLYFEKDVKVKLGVLASLSLLFLLNYYLFWSGRYLRHRVDISLCLLAIIALLYFIENSKINYNEKKIKKLYFPLLIIVLSIPYNYYGDDSFLYTDEMKMLIDENTKFYHETA